MPGNPPTSNQERENPLLRLLGKRSQDDVVIDELKNVSETISVSNDELNNNFEDLTLSIKKGIMSSNSELKDSLNSNFEKEYKVLGSLQSNISNKIQEQIEILRVELGDRIVLSIRGLVRYFVLLGRSFFQRRKEARQLAKRQDELSDRTTFSILTIGKDIVESLALVRESIANLRTRKSKEETLEERQFTKNQYSLLGKSIKEAIQGIKLEAKQPEDRGLLGLLLFLLGKALIKPVLLVAGAYIYRSLFVLFKGLGFVKNMLNLSKVSAVFLRFARLFGTTGKFAIVGIALGRLGSFFKNLGKVFSKTGTIGKIFGIFTKVFGGVGKILSPVFKILGKVGKFFRAVPVLGQVITVIEGIIGFFRGFFGTDGSFLDKLIAGIQGIFAQIISGLTLGFVSFDDVMEFFDDATTALGDFFYGVYDFFANTIPDLFEKTKTSILEFLGIEPTQTEIPRSQYDAAMRQNLPMIEIDEFGINFVPKSIPLDPTSLEGLGFRKGISPLGSGVVDEQNSLDRERTAPAMVDDFGERRGDTNTVIQQNNNFPSEQQYDAAPLIDQGLGVYVAPHPYFGGFTRGFGMQ